MTRGWLFALLFVLAGCSYTRFEGTRPSDGLRVSGVAFNFITDRNLSVASDPEHGFSGTYSNAPNAELGNRAFATVEKALDKIPGPGPRQLVPELSPVVLPEAEEDDGP
jgi:hypothetical protein